MDIQAEVDQRKIKSRAGRSMELGENANDHDPMAGQVKEISIGGNQMRQSICNGKVARNESTKSGSAME